MPLFLERVVRFRGSKGAVLEVDHSWTGIWAPQHIVGRPRLILGKKEGETWHFSSSVP